MGRGASTRAGSPDRSANGTCPVPVEVYTSPMRSTKIVATIGPASREPAELEQMIAVGMDVARLNFAHCDSEEHVETIERIRASAVRGGRDVAMLHELPDAKHRLGPVVQHVGNLEAAIRD